VENGKKEDGKKIKMDEEWEGGKDRDGGSTIWSEGRGGNLWVWIGVGMKLERNMRNGID
jgi:hypothetical protein